MKMRIKACYRMYLAQRYIDFGGKRPQLFARKVAKLPLNRSKLVEHWLTLAFHSTARPNKDLRNLIAKFNLAEWLDWGAASLR